MDDKINNDRTSVMQYRNLSKLLNLHIVTPKQFLTKTKQTVVNQNPIRE